MPITGLTPLEDFEVIASSSDHLVVDTTRMNLMVGDNVTFKLNYTALLMAMTSPFITKEFL